MKSGPCQNARGPLIPIRLVANGDAGGEVCVEEGVAVAED